MLVGQLYRLYPVEGIIGDALAVESQDIPAPFRQFHRIGIHSLYIPFASDLLKNRTKKISKKIRLARLNVNRMFQSEKHGKSSSSLLQISLLYSSETSLNRAVCIISGFKHYALRNSFLRQKTTLFTPFVANSTPSRNKSMKKLRKTLERAYFLLNFAS